MSGVAIGPGGAWRAGFALACTLSGTLAFGGTAELYPGGPRLRETPDSLELTLGPEGSRAALRALYDANRSLRSIETYNEDGRRISWTTFRPGITETAYDLGETGHATRWERWEPGPKRGSLAFVIQEREPGTGRRIERERIVYPAAQAAHCGLEAKAIDADIGEAVNAIEQRWLKSPTACPPPSALTFDDGAHAFKSAGPFCLDEACGLNDNFQHLLGDTVRQGVACLARLGTDRLATPKAARGMSALGDIVKNGGGAAARNAGFLGKSFALRNAGQLLMVLDQTENLGALWSSQAQDWQLSKGTGRVAYATTDEVQKSLATGGAGPLKFYCSKADWKNPEGGQLPAIEEAGKVPSFNYGDVRMLATLPGVASWPSIGIPKGVGKNYAGEPASEDDRRTKALLFHEMMHLLGYPHIEANYQDTGGAFDTLGGARTAPAAVACQACCFPEGFTWNGNWKPEDPDCGLQSSAHRTACAVCAGDMGTERDALKAWNFKPYDQAIRKCYRNVQPL